MKETELKPCPFCGGEAVLESTTECMGHGEYIKKHYVMCAKCGTKGKSEYEYSKSSEKCITDCKEAWNRRADNEQREAD